MNSGFGFAVLSDLVDEEVGVDKNEGSEDDDCSYEEDDNEPVRQCNI